ncbi:MAG: PLP-dependent transferase [Elusimicrobia bacterium]|nr:PLP-dependent transferase [Elusimicrobiota bacterium]
MKDLDLRSDTVTWPTPAMREAMARAEVGDDVCGEDPTVNRLEAEAARLTGKEAALLVPSGTFANQCALLTWAGSGDEVVLAERCHIVQHEAGAAALLARAQLRAASPGSAHLLPEDVAARVRPEGDIHYPRTALVCVEQATSDGTVVPIETLAALRKAAGGVPVHMDGARLFNAAAALGVPAGHVARHADSVMFCLSKGLCAPVGSMLCGSADFISRARRNRNRMGGGMRQAGVLAAAGLVALREVLPTLSEDHAKARRLAAALRQVPGVEVLREPDISLVFCRLPGLKKGAEALVAAMASRGIRIYPDEAGVFRFVTHRWTDDAGLSRFVEALRAELAKA